jgi:integrase-like protein
MPLEMLIFIHSLIHEGCQRHIHGQSEWCRWGRKRGSIRHLGNELQVRVSAGNDPAAGERLVLVESVRIEKPGNVRAAQKEAEKILTRLQGEADSLKVARTKSTCAALLDRWLVQHELDATTRMNYEWIIRDHIRPVLGDIPLLLLARARPSAWSAFMPIFGGAGCAATESRSSSTASMVHTSGGR